MTVSCPLCRRLRDADTPCPCLRDSAPGPMLADLEAQAYGGGA